jgi:molybdopterin-guanine dinucleotide biosynthesis protein A
LKIYGLVLAGGRSSRFGQEKAAAEVAGRPMLAWVLDVLGPACVEVAVSAKPGSLASTLAERAAHPVLSDQACDPQGPLAGVRAGLLWAKAKGADLLASAPCDAPFLPPDLVASLAQGWSPGDGARVAVSPCGLEPVCALWPVAALDLIHEALAGGRHPPIRHVLEQLRGVEVRFPDAHAFANLNTPADYAAATRSDSAEQNQDDDDDQHQPEAAGRIIAP